MAPEAEGLSNFALPSLIVSPTDVTRVRRELEALDAYLDSQRIREPGSPTPRLPKLSRLLDDLAIQNKANLLHATVRQDLLDFLKQLTSTAPVVHVSFAVEPSSAALERVVLWFRSNIQPYVLVRVGLQPTIVAGCTLRTTNQYFDFSLRNTLKERRQFLHQALKATAQTAVSAAAPEVAEAERG